MINLFRYEGWKIEYNDDLSGDVLITHDTDIEERIGRCEMNLPGELLLQFTAHLIRTRVQSLVSQYIMTANAKDIVGIVEGKFNTGTFKCVECGGESRLASINEYHKKGCSRLG